MPDDAARAVCTPWGQLVDRSLEAVERVGVSAGAHLEALIVVVAHITGCHNRSSLAERDSSTRVHLNRIRLDRRPARIQPKYHWGAAQLAATIGD
jgi:hypothetical protein